MTRPDSGADEGQVSTALVVLGCFLLLVMAFQAVRPLVEATDQSSRAQSAGDAAALAAADRVRDDLVAGLAGGLGDEADVFDLLSSSMGRDAAEDFATRNGAELVDYDYDWSRDEITVEVRTTDRLEGGERSAARATAELGLALGSCAWDPRPAPSPPATPPVPPTTPAPAPTAAPTPTDPPDLDLVLRCPGRDLHFRLVGATGLIRLHPPGQLDHVLEPRLIR